MKFFKKNEKTYINITHRFNFSLNENIEEDSNINFDSISDTIKTFSQNLNANYKLYPIYRGIEAYIWQEGEVKYNLSQCKSLVYDNIQETVNTINKNKDIKYSLSTLGKLSSKNGSNSFRIESNTDSNKIKVNML